LEKQANGITGPQTDFCFPFDRRYWASNERGQDVESRHGDKFWYPWEQMGYWVDGAYRCAKLIEDSHLRNRAMEPIQYTVAHPVDGWFLGPQRLYDVPANHEPGRWPQAVFFRALAGAAEGENSAEILSAICRHYLQDTEFDYQHGPMAPRDQVNIESVLWCYAHSGDKRLLEKARDIWAKVSAEELRDLTADRPSRDHGSLWRLMLGVLRAGISCVRTATIRNGLPRPPYPRIKAGWGRRREYPLCPWGVPTCD
jgi:uncharacterized protein